MSIQALTRLRREHHNLKGLLRILERQIAGIDRGDRPDYRLMHDIVHYLTYYPDRYHHPFEDLLFDRLAARRPELQPVLDGLHRQHGRIACNGAGLRDAVAAVLDGLVMPREDLVHLGQGYVADYRHHMRTEETQVFDALAEALSPADWLSLVTAFHWGLDPLFADTVSQEYCTLREHISAAGAGPWPWRFPEGASCGVCTGH